MLSLSNILKLNAISSGATGLALVLFPKFFADVFEVASTAPFVGVGIFLTVFALFVFVVSTGNIKKSSVATVVALDVLWVVASIIAIIFLYSLLSFLGVLLIAGVALWVALMAYLQCSALRQLHEGRRLAHHAITAIAFFVLNNAAMGQNSISYNNHSTNNILHEVQMDNNWNGR